MGSSIWAVLVITLAGSTKMAPCGKALLVLLVSGHCVLGARQLRNNRNLPREQRNLLGTFPFNAQVAEDDHYGHHEEHDASPRQSLESRPARQGGDDTDVSFGAVAGVAPGSDGKRCIDKLEMVEETEY